MAEKSTYEDQGAGAGVCFWYLEGFVDSGRQTWRTLIRSLPLVVGRHPDCGLRLFSRRVSHRHAELFERNGQLWVRDLSSTNGTAVNLQSIQTEKALAEGDILHFGDLELRLSIYRPSTMQDTTLRDVLDTGELSSMLGCSASLRRLLEQGSIRSLFQPVVELPDRRVLGYEALSRGNLDGLESSPAEMFSVAESIGLATELSDLCRERAFAAARVLSGSPLLFINLHPDELQRPRHLIRSLRLLREADPARRLVVEVNEATGCSIDGMRRFQEALHDLDIQLAFDDFGTGRARLLEIAEVPPDYLKFDISMIRDLHSAPETRRRVLAGLVDLAHSLEITPIAEGVEGADEATACEEVGFCFAQGYFFGLPVPVTELHDDLTQDRVSLDHRFAERTV